MKFTFTVKKADIDKAYEEVVKEAIKTTSLKGFRKGQAPKDMVIKAVGETKLQQHAIEHALPEAYTAEIKKRKLSPISYPNIKLKDGTPGKDFEFEAEIAQLPEVKLGDYQKKLKGELAKDKIWTPEKGETSENQEPSRDQKIQTVARILLDTIKIEIPQLLIDREVNRMLSRLVNQVEQLGLKMEDYLSSMNQTQEKIKEQYTESASNSLSLEFILMEIAKEEKIEVKAEEIDSFIAGVNDKKLQESLSTPEEKANIYGIVLKQKVMDHLIKIAS